MFEYLAQKQDTLNEEQNLDLQILIIENKEIIDLEGYTEYPFKE